MTHPPNQLNAPQSLLHTVSHSFKETCHSSWKHHPIDAHHFQIERAPNVGCEASNEEVEEEKEEKEEFLLADGNSKSLTNMIYLV